jgi:soluble lytic murein transglycosylase-like protein
MMTRLNRLLLPALAALFISSSAILGAVGTARAESVCEREMTRAAARFEVPLGVLYAVGLTETGRKSGLSPYAMNIAGRSHFADSPAEAVREFRSARSKGVKLIDLGCMQINHHYHGERFSSVEAMLDPAQNVDYAARFLSELREREGSWTMAVARYHAGPNNNPAQKRYVCAVIRNMVASGFGQWTPNAKSFCDA